MSRDSSRLIMELDKHRREVNRATINPSLSALDADMLLPVVKTCARARAEYIEYFVEICDTGSEENCTSEQISKLNQLRMAYEELVSAANALETVIKRGYVDVKES